MEAVEHYVSVIHTGTFPCIWAGGTAKLVVTRVQDGPVVTFFSGAVQIGDPNAPASFAFPFGKLFSDDHIEIEITVSGHSQVGKGSLFEITDGVQVWRGSIQGATPAATPGAIPPFDFELMVPVDLSGANP